MRRTSILTSIGRIARASQRWANEKEKTELIQTKSSYIPQEPTYSLSALDFDKTTRIAKIEILQSQMYKTIEKYVTRDYVRYPIYSGWKAKHKSIKKTIKLTNQALEELNTNSDDLISLLSRDIVVQMHDEELLPSWFIKENLIKDYAIIINNLKTQITRFTDAETKKISDFNRQKDQYEIQLCPIQKKYDRKIAKLTKVRAKIEAISNANPGIINKLRLKLCNRKEAKLSSITDAIGLSVKELQDKIGDCDAEVSKCVEAISVEQKKIQKRIQKEEGDLNNKIAAIRPLALSASSDQDVFIPLQEFAGFNYEKIIGCYVIHNRQNDKFYVGQSKDVIKRIKQHFKGTVPNNVIFAEDYYSTSAEQRDQLFEIKITRCNTKDELDDTERNLIQLYDSFNCGYNGTAGNT